MSNVQMFSWLKYKIYIKSWFPIETTITNTARRLSILPPLIFQHYYHWYSSITTTDIPALPPLIFQHYTNDIPALHQWYSSITSLSCHTPPSNSLTISLSLAAPLQVPRSLSQAPKSNKHQCSSYLSSQTFIFVIFGSIDESMLFLLSLVDNKSV